MDLDGLLHRAFGTADLSQLTPAGLDAGVERLRVDFGLEQDRDKRFALFAVLHLLGQAPDLDVAFAHEADREAARNFMDLLASGEG